MNTGRGRSSIAGHIKSFESASAYGNLRNWMVMVVVVVVLERIQVAGHSMEVCVPGSR